MKRSECPLVPSSKCTMNIAWVVIFSIYVVRKVRGCQRESNTRREAEMVNLDRTVPWPPGFRPRGEMLASHGQLSSERR